MSEEPQPNPEKTYWMGLKQSLDEKAQALDEAAIPFGWDYIKPIECDQLVESAKPIAPLLEEAISSLKSTERELISINPFEFMMVARWEIENLGELTDLLENRFRGICTTQDPQIPRVLGHIHERLRHIKNSNIQLFGLIDKIIESFGD